MSASVILGLVLLAALGAIAYAALNFFLVKRLDEGTERMKEIASAIRIGANAFVTYETKIVVMIALAIALVLCILISWQTACAFLIGATMSASASWVGLKIATYANVRVANTARITANLGQTLQVAFRGGSVMGLCVGGFALLGVFIVYVIFGHLLGQIGQLTIEGARSVNWLGLEAPFTMTISGYALGCSIIAMFNRVGGGIYTKAADMGADLVGKTEAHIPEDDPRNPATIADNVGDNVGDVAGLGADLLESYVSALLAAAILASELFRSSKTTLSDRMLNTMLYYPLTIAACGLIACVIGIGSILVKKRLSANPHFELNLATWISAGLTILLSFVATFFLFKVQGFSADELYCAGFSLGAYSPCISAAIGIIAGIVIGGIAEYYTSYDFKPTKKLASASVEGAALIITEGLSLGMRSCMGSVAVLGLSIYCSYAVGGMYGVAVAALGMLSFVSATVSVDTYGPISDNSGGIAEMSTLASNVREITDKLDSVGNTTAAIGKGFAIGSAALAALSMMVSYLYTYTDASDDILLNIIDPLTLAGALVGAALPYLFSGMLIDAVAKAARQMVEEVRRQFREIKGLLEGKVLPDYKTCIEISSQGALREMRLPAILSVVFPVVCGFLFGANFVGGILIGATISAIMLAIFTGNAGGAWDNAKKYVETGAIQGHGKGSDAHSAAVVGDTVGDPLKDTVGPSLDILIKIMSVVSLIAVTLFGKYNLITWLRTLFHK
ncbi:MAG: sodium-translocating pyrophosphatase [Victivallales bacterium]|nr:sodium-translocating pyrophosphatase [Victivallales bacterium]